MKTNAVILLRVKEDVKDEVTEGKKEIHNNQNINPQKKYIILNVYAPNNITSNFIKQTIDRIVWERQAQNQSWRF